MDACNIQNDIASDAKSMSSAERTLSFKENEF